MIRQTALTEWKCLKEKMISFKKVNFTKKERECLEFMSEKLAFSDALSSFPQGQETIRRNLSWWISNDYQAKIQVEKEEIINKTQEFAENGTLSFLQVAFLNNVSMFEALTIGWWREINKPSDSEPAIEYVD